MNVLREKPIAQIRPLHPVDLSGVVTVHCAAFTSSALTALGRGAVRRYYEWQLVGPHDAVALGAWVKERLAGFCFAGTFRGALGGFIASNRRYLAARVITRPWLLSNDIFRDRLKTGVRLLAQRLSSGRRSGDGSTAPRKNFGVLAIAVDPRVQGLGIGNALMRETTQIAIRRGFRHINLTVHPENTATIEFYERLGWQRTGGPPWQGAMSLTLEGMA